MIVYLVELFFLFLMWNMYSYLIHRFSHIHFKGNILMWIHMAHHQVEYVKDNDNNGFVLPHWSQYLFWFGTFRESLDVWISVAPLVPLMIFKPEFGIPIFILVYIYESTLSEHLLDHNPRITDKKLTKFFAWGQYHLVHHHFYKKNYAFIFTLWDSVFNTSKNKAQPGPIVKERLVFGIRN